MIPKEVIAVAEDRTDIGGHLKLIGHYKGYEVYSYEYDGPVTVGLPVYYLWDGTHVKTICDRDGYEGSTNIMADI